MTTKKIGVLCQRWPWFSARTAKILAPTARKHRNGQRRWVHDESELGEEFTVNDVLSFDDEEPYSPRGPRFM
jgi:hypothetical protein